MNSNEVFDTISSLQRSSTPFVLVTLSETKGHAPQEIGAKAIVTLSGLHWGTVGGGKVEAKAIDLSLELLSQKRNQFLKKYWNLQKDVGMSCGGEVEFIFEVYHSNPWKIVIFGAGHIAQELVPLVLKFPCQVNCVDTRSEWLDKLETHNQLTKHLVKDYCDFLNQVSEEMFCIVMTRGHATDLPVLKGILEQHSPAYVGVIGSEVKSIKIKNELKTFGISANRIEKLRCPMGLAIGGNDPAEIAVSIAAQLLQVRDQIFGLKRSWKAPHSESSLL